MLRQGQAVHGGCCSRRQPEELPTETPHSGKKRPGCPCLVGNSWRCKPFCHPHTPTSCLQTDCKADFMVAFPFTSHQGAALANSAFSSASLCCKVAGDQCANAHAQVDKQTRGHAQERTQSDLTKNIKLSLSLSEKSHLISFCKHHLYTEDDFSCHLSVSPPV